MVFFYVQVWFSSQCLNFYTNLSDLNNNDAPRTGAPVMARGQGQLRKKCEADHRGSLRLFSGHPFCRLLGKDWGAEGVSEIQLHVRWGGELHRSVRPVHLRQEKHERHGTVPQAGRRDWRDHQVLADQDHRCRHIRPLPSIALHVGGQQLLLKIFGTLSRGAAQPAQKERSRQKVFESLGGHLQTNRQIEGPVPLPMT